jgi:hypothetical protein
MIGLFCFALTVLASPFKSKLRLEAENAVLRHQLMVLTRRLHGRVRLTNNDRWFFIQLYRWVPSGYDTTHVYVAPEDVDKFAASFLSAFGGQSTKQVVATVTPTPSSTTSQLLQTPVGTVSLFGFKTPIPYPFGAERTGYLVTDIDEAIKVAKDSGADVLVATFPDPIGRDAVIQWPSGVNMQLYWHTTKPSYAAFETIPRTAFTSLPNGRMPLPAAFSGSRMGRSSPTMRMPPGSRSGERTRSGASASNRCSER